MTEEWVLKKILENLQRQSEHRLTQLVVVDEETGGTKVVMTKQTGDQPPEVVDISKENNIEGDE